MEPAAVLLLFFKNLEEIKRWYRRASDSGRDFGHVLLIETTLTHVSEALEKALKGESWSPPEHTP